MAQIYKITFWNAEKCYEAPATRTKRLQLTGVQQATLSWDFSEQNGTGFDNVAINGSIVSTNKKGSVDVTQYVIANGDNMAAFNYRGSPLNLGNLLPEGIITCSLDVTATTAGASAPTTTYSFNNLPWWAYAIIIIVVLLIVYFVLKKFSVIGGASDIPKLIMGTTGVGV